MDSVQFALALDHFDVTVHQPHPPGYFLYVMLGRVFNKFINDPNTTFISISIIFSVLTVLVTYRLGEELFDSRCATIAALYAVVSPNLWFHGEVALSYTVESFFSALIALLCWRIHNGKTQYIWMLALAMAVAGGVRQNTPVFLAPVCLYSLRKVSIPKVLAVFCVFVVFSLFWFIPMTRMTGGFDSYVEALRQIWLSTAAPNTVFHKGWQALTHHSFILFNFVAYGIGGGIVVLIFFLYYVIRNRKCISIDTPKATFSSLWILPSFLFFLLISIGPSVPGHVLIFLPPLLLLAAKSTVCLSDELTRLLNRDFLFPITFILILTNLYIFFCLTYPVSYPTIREHDRTLSTVIAKMKVFDPTAFVLFMDENDIYYGLSHAIYYLPDYRSYDSGIISFSRKENLKIWGGYGKRTLLTDKIVLPEGTNNFATLLFTEEKNRLAPKGGCKIENLLPGVSLVSGHVACLNEIYPKLELCRRLSHITN